MPVAAPARWQPVVDAGGSRCKEASQSVSQSVGAKPPTYADARTSPKVAAGSPPDPQW